MEEDDKKFNYHRKIWAMNSISKEMKRNVRIYTFHTKFFQLILQICYDTLELEVSILELESLHKLTK